MSVCVCVFLSVCEYAKHSTVILYLLLSLDDKTCELCAPLSSTRFTIHYENDDDNNDVDSSSSSNSEMPMTATARSTTI